MNYWENKMKIQGLYNTGEIDTDKMPDAISEFFEKQHELCMLAQKYDIPFFSFSFGDKILMSQHFIKNSEDNSPENKAEYNKRFSNFMGFLNSKIKFMTNGDFEILPSKLNKNLENEE